MIRLMERKLFSATATHLALCAVLISTSCGLTVVPCVLVQLRCRAPGSASLPLAEACKEATAMQVQTSTYIDFLQITLACCRVGASHTPYRYADQDAHHATRLSTYLLRHY
ncbi:hypothetical protein EJ03DRAFT_134709 [Teratosphaeria nubilosa]|uniref:Uncharacterized protein n=1 Tax=Teratosphaeria nubilosa TaxID=161662 RepID=A0A6G1L7I4_9PEZI|nr:hypothetical protein EJ03DRAFT_134709 [Teratosphaeria nubilosa]